MFICIILFSAILEDILDYEINNFDVASYNMVSKIISDKITPIAKVITRFGNAETLIFITIVLVIYIKDKKVRIAIPVNLFCASILNFTLKNIVQRPRPNEFRIIDQSGYSFPSGHSMVSMAFYGFLVYLIFKNVKNKYIKILLIFILASIIFMIGLSRIYLGVHYTSDVLGGFLLALSYLTLYTMLFKTIYNKNLQ